MKKLFITLGIIFLALFVVGATFAVGLFTGVRIEEKKQAELSRDYPSVEKVSEALHIIKENYVEDTTADKLIDGAVKGMLQALEDPYTHYLDKKDFGYFKEQTTGKFEGVGMIIGAKDGHVAVVSPLEGTPAERAGIKAGDIIAEIDGKNTKGMSVDDAVSKIRGKKGTMVSLVLMRSGIEEPIKVKLTREEINQPNFKSDIYDGKLGYVRITQGFNEQTDADMRKHLEKVKKDGAKGIILDLRGNPGGLLDSAVNVVSKFVDSGAVVKIQGRDGRVRSDLVRPDDLTDTRIPLVVLVNHGSASASEIVAGAVQDYNRGVIVGEQTFGKASVQTVINLTDGTALLLTTDKYLTPNGRMIHKKGIKPDVVVKFDEKAMEENKKDNQLERAKEVLEELISGKRKP